MDQFPDVPLGRRRARWLGAALVPVIAIGAAETSERRIEKDLDRRTASALQAAGYDVEVFYSGQDAHIRCVSPTSDIDGMEALIVDMRGPRDRKRDIDEFVDVASCTGAATTPAPTDTTTAPAPVATEAPVPVSALDAKAVLAEGANVVVLQGTVDTEQQHTDLLKAAQDAFGAANVTDKLLVAGNPGDLSDANVASLATMIGAMPGNVLSAEAGYAQASGLYFNAKYPDDAAKAKLDAALGALPDLKPEMITLEGAPVPVTDLGAEAVLENGSSKITLTGVVQTQAQHDALVAAAAAAFGPEDVIDQLTIAPNGAGTAETDDLVNRMGTLAGYMNGRLASGTAGIKEGNLYVSGVYVSQQAQTEMQAQATSLGVEPANTALEPLPAATADCAAALTTQINELVAATPIPFDPGSANLTADAGGLLDQVAALALSCGRATINVEGHTDADGSDASNLALSQKRADTVLQALVQRGVPAEQLSATGFGETQPLAPNDTPENKAKNRRVVFSVTAQ